MSAPRSVRAIPAVEKVLQTLGDVSLPRPYVVALIRRELAVFRAGGKVPPLAGIIRQIRRGIDDLKRSRLQPVINGTGIIIHTNFGRAPLGSDAIRTITEVASAYNNLEYDLTTGARGRRAGYLENGLSLLCGSEAATVVNNCAAALVLIVRHFTRKKPEVIISRGELIQIGGGFRIGEILEASGARLREVGATNKTALRDYAKAIGPETGLILKVDQSNFFISGFAGAPSSEEIAKLARAKRIPFVEDLGSGAVTATEKLGLEDHEPTPNETLKRGVDLVCFSGDKLLGGPQAGIIAGKARFVAALKREPLFRALRCDKLVFAALAATVEAHLRTDQEQIPDSEDAPDSNRRVAGTRRKTNRTPAGPAAASASRGEQGADRAAAPCPVRLSLRLLLSSSPAVIRLTNWRRFFAVPPRPLSVISRRANSGSISEPSFPSRTRWLPPLCAFA